MSDAIWVILVLDAIFCGIIAGMIGGSKGEGDRGFFLGLLLGPFGIAIALLTIGNRVKCKYCQKLIDLKATICPYCQSNHQPNGG